MTSSNLVGCITGKSAGFSPLRMRPGTDTDLAKGVQNAGSIAHQSAGFDIFTGSSTLHGVLRRRFGLHFIAHELVFDRTFSKVSRSVSDQVQLRAPSDSRAPSSHRETLGREDSR